MRFLKEAALILWIFASLARAQTAADGDCDAIYSQTEYTECPTNCGSCFNPNGRSNSEEFPVVTCPVENGNTGYLCSPDGGVFACMDWTFGSNRMKAAEEAFNQRVYSDKPDQHVWFGVGTFGTTEDEMEGLGNCYRLSVVDTICGGSPGAGTPLERNIIVQSINTGSDVSNIQFDLQVGNGGTGAYNNCAGSSWSMFPGEYTYEIWGDQFGGSPFRDFSEGSPSCDDLPPLPQDPDPMVAQGDDLINLCKYSFDKRARVGTTNPTIVDMARVQCPDELVQMTQVKRLDDPSTYEIEEENRPSDYQNGAPDVEPCRCSCGNYDCRYCLTRMMDCRKPSGGFADHMIEEFMADGMKVVQPCTNDGYTRVDVKCGCYDCYC